MAETGAQEQTRFVDRVTRLLERVDYRIAETVADREAIFRLRYEAYLREGALDPNLSRRFTDEYDEVEHAQLFGLYVDGQLCSSMRIHAGRGEHAKMPGLWAFADLLQPELKNGRMIVDPSRFTTDLDASRRYPELAYVTARLGWVAGEYYNADIILSTARVEHQAFYRRVFGYKVMSECRPYHMLKKPLSLMFLDFQAQKAQVQARYPFFRSTVFERRMLFERPIRATRQAA